MTSLADGEWHRLHPASPLLRGGIFIVAVLGFVIANLRERLVDEFFGVRAFDGNPIDEILRRGAVGWALLGIVVILVLILAGFYLSWRMHTFRVNEEVVEVRSGLVFRSNRRARLDRIQGVNIVRPFIPRLFGAAKLEVSVAGQDANVQLAYLGSAPADALRRDILHLASGLRQKPTESATAAVDSAAAASAATPTTASAASAAAPVPNSGTEAREDAESGDFRTRSASAPEFGTAHGGVSRVGPAGAGVVGGIGGVVGGIGGVAGGIGGFASDRAREFFAPELDPDAAPPESVVRIPPGRLIGSVFFSGFTVLVVLAVVAIGVSVASGGTGWLLVAVLPGLIGSLSYYVSRFVKSLRYSIAGTPDGVRVGFGLLSTSNETLPPGRIHAIRVSQPLLWRPFGWWQVRINTAGHSTNKGAAGEANTTTLPVGTEADVARVLELILPGFDSAEHLALIGRGLRSKGGDDGFVNAPRRAAWLRVFSWRRTGYALSDGIALLRRGVVSRELILVPLARLQSVGISQGPVLRMLGLASARLHTVSGPVEASLGVIDAAEAERLFELISAGAARSAQLDTGHHWNRSRPDGAPEAAPEAAPGAAPEGAPEGVPE